MKITCHACDAKYTIADEKVTGRTVKIKCKKCGATIVVNADTGAPQVGGAAAAPYGDPQAHQAAGDDDGLMATRVAGMDGAPSPATPEWTVALGDQERQMSQLQLAEEMQRGTVNGDTYVWRDGMADWLAVSQVPELAALLARAAQPAPVVQAPAAAHAPAPHQEEHLGLAGTIVMGEGSPMSPFAAPRPAAGAAPAPMAAAPAPAAAPQASSASAGLSPVNQPTAARRANRGASVDVFTAAAEGREAAPQASPDRPRPPTPAGRLGERNENSVLFSLSALTATENAAAKSKPDDAVIDLGMGNGKGGGSAVDDLMNLGGGGIGGPMLAPPPLLAPVVEPPPAPMPAPVAEAQPVMNSMGATAVAIPPAPPKSKTGLIIGIVAGVLVLGGIGAVFALGGGGGSGSTNAAVESSGTPATPSSAPATTSAPSATAPTDTPPVASGAPSGSAAVASNDTGGKTPSGGTVAGSGTGAAPKSSASSATSAAPTASAKATTDTPAPTASAAATGDGTGGRDFNKGAATTALSAAAAAARGCKTADGPTGSASVRVVFAPSGNVTSANVQGPPFAGTPVGGCIAAAFRGAHVPPFDGSPVAVSKTVNIN